MFAAYIITEAGEDIRLYSSGREFQTGILEKKIRERLKKNERLKFVKPIKMEVVEIDGTSKLSGKQTQIKFAKDFISSICRAFCLEEYIYYSKCRLQMYRDVKYCVYKILRDSTTLSLKSISIIHNRDHATVINGLRRFNELNDFDFDFKSTYKSCLLIFESELLQTQKNVK